MHPLIILASSSPYRRGLLERLRLPFSVISPEVDETPLEQESPHALALRLAQAKASAVAAQVDPNTIVIGSDQVAEANGQALGKPLTRQRAIEQLLKLSDQWVVFHTAMAVVHGGQVMTTHCPTRLKMRALNEAEVARYVDADSPLHCAGALKTESLGIALMESFESQDPTAIIGLPLISLSQHLRTLGIALP